ncbi:Stf0 family sulfotransferase [Ruegeria sp. Ofav3-42]|uniref:Stf0 family sulfotransferase n=1 Tax=Ruegeria sp. Ofav3-42 TaxID=2917759 RepID=UPI001EF5C3BF|nr:Stf0 family sulfotransferase [Ruegeria sp. Ofav3-42]MCG7519421.1 Stf0 sulfotransferase family protein [Ruegeria sp. Ofav3-42]
MLLYDSYVICTSPRSGSTLLCKLLSQTNLAGRPSSYFHAPSVPEWLNYFGLNAADFEDRAQALRAVFKAARTQGTAGTGIFGLRLQGQTLDFFLAQLRLLHPAANSDTARISSEFGRTLFIHLSRKDKLEQAVSFVKAAQTGLWHRNADGTEMERTAPPARPEFDSVEIAHRKKEFEGMDHRWRDWFLTQDIDPLQVDYDHLAASPAQVVADILAQLGLDPNVPFDIEPPTSRLADATNREWVRRFLSESRA